MDAHWYSGGDAVQGGLNVESIIVESIIHNQKGTVLSNIMFTTHAHISLIICI